MRGPLSPVADGYKRLRLKRWHYTSVATQRIFFACAVVDAGYVGSAFAYVVDRSSGAMTEWSTLSPLARDVTIAPNSIDGDTRIERGGFGTLVLGNDARTGIRTVTARLEGALGAATKPPLAVDVEIWDWGREPDPVVVVEESAPGRWLYTHKCYGLEAAGRIRCGALDQQFGTAEGHAGLDWNLGYRPYETWWNWAAGGGTSSDGSRVGFNLTAHRPWVGSGREGTVPDGEAGDCAIWVDGRRIKIQRAEFDYDPEAVLQRWRVHDDAGLVDLCLSPLGQRKENVNFGAVVSQFRQPYGLFSGTLRTPEGSVKELIDVFGVTEQHFARW